MTRRRKRRIVPVVLVGMSLAGCATAPPDQGFSGVADAVEGRIPQRVAWSRGTPADKQASAAVATLLSRPLGAEDAVQVALLRNRGLQASYAELGLAQADLVEAGLLQNPVFDTSIRFPDAAHLATDLETGLTQSFLDLLLLPAKKEIAAGQAEATKLRVAAEVLDLVAEVKTAYFRLEADQAIGALLHDRVSAADAAASLARRLHDAGNISDLDLSRQQADTELTRTEYADALAGAAADREELNRLMGLFGADTGWTVPDHLPDVPPEALPYDRLEAMAISGNLRIAALRRQAETSAKALGIATNFGWLTDVQIGVSSEKNPEGYRVTGPTIQIPIPLFNRGQASRARAAAALQQNEDQMAQLAIDTRAQVRALRDRLLRTRDLIDRYNAVVVPLQRRMLALGLQQYNFMLLGPFDLLRTKQDEIAASRRLIEATRDYWIARAELDRALSGQAAPKSPHTAVTRPAARLVTPPLVTHGEPA
jgi:cobalt-zinc-cadmium efflux system outer membrane protein